MQKKYNYRKWVVLCTTFLLTLGAAFLVVGTTSTTVEAASTSATLKKKADSIISKAKVKKTDSKKTKLKKLFQYVEKNYGYARVVGFQNTKGWEKTYALEMIKKKKGSCYHFAAMYAFLAKRATNYPVQIGIGKTKGFGNKNQPHAWVEIKINKTWYVCDPNMDKFAADSSLKYYLKKRSKLKSTYYKYSTKKSVGTTYVTVEF